MARAAIVLGLGGTGQWVLTYLKNDLLETNNGIMPDNVQLLGVDTQSPDVQLLKAGDNVEGDNRMANLTDAQVGTVRLNKINEFFQIGGPLYGLVTQIHNQNPKPEEFRWLDTDLFFNGPPNICNTVYGAGAYRQLGRLSLFNHVDHFYNRLIQLINQGRLAINNQVMAIEGGNQAERLEIIIVSSLAGGTGAGIFLDVAWLVRAAAKAIDMNPDHYQLTGYFIMPTAWEQAGQDSEKRLRSYAAWRELNRFMLRPVDRENPTEILYNPAHNPPIIGHYDHQIFDNAYIIDPDRSGSSLKHLRPEDATYPVVAEAISALLDGTLGQMISQDNSNNDAIILGLPRAVYYNTLGTFTLKTPEHFSKLQIQNEYRMAVLEQLIAPNFGPSGEATGVRRDCNAEAQPSTVEHGAETFLTTAQHANINNNLLLRDIQNVSTKGQELNGYVLEESKRIVGRKGKTFIALTSQVNDRNLQPRLDDLVREEIWHVVIPSGDRKNATPRGIKQEVFNSVEAKDVEWFGQWGYIADPRNPAIQIQTRITEGSKVRLLREAGNALVRNFKVLLENWSSNQLNGVVHDAVVAKSGKLGYLLGVYEELDQKFSAYLNYLNLLEKRISDNGTRVTLTEARDAARKRYDMLAGKECIFAFFDNNVHPHARDAERNFLRATNNLFQYYLSESIINVLAETVRTMQQFTLESKKKLEDWVMILAVGRPDGDPERRFTSLYNYSWGIVRTGTNGLKAEIRRGNPHFETNRELRGVQQMLNLQIANNHYQANDRIATFAQDSPQLTPYLATEEIQSGLDAFTWRVGQPAGGATLEFSLEIRDENNNLTPLLSAQTNDAIMQNYSRLNKELNRRFDIIMGANPENQVVSPPIISVLNRYFQDTQEFARQLKELSTPLFRKRERAEIVFKKNSMFMRLNGDTDTDYFNALQNDVQNQLVGTRETINIFNNPGNAIMTLDPYKFTFLQYHHLIPITQFPLFNNLENVFNIAMAQPNQVVSPRVHYTFNAERKAHELALLRVMQGNEIFRSFEPEIVGLLEYPERTGLFFLAFAQGLLVFDDGRGFDNTTLKLNGTEVMDEVILFNRDEINTDNANKLTMYEAINYWLAGKDDRPNVRNRIDWGKLQRIIRSEELGDGMADVIVAYRKQMDADDPESLVSLIHYQANRRAEAVQAANQLFYQEKMFDDLIDLARVIYTERVEKLEEAQMRRGY